MEGSVRQRLRSASTSTDTVYIKSFISYFTLIDIRQHNLSLLQTYGSNAWRIHNYLLEATVKQVEKALEELKDLTVELNRQRKNDQVRIFKTLTVPLNDNDRIELESN